MPFFMKRDVSRKYIDLLYTVDSRYANWDPSRRYELGDFGSLDPKSGAFWKEGNIFDPKLLFAEHLESLREQITSEGTEVEVVMTRGVKKQGGNVDAKASIPGIIDLTNSWSFTFGKHTGAVLLIPRPKTTRFACERDIGKVLHDLRDHLGMKDKAVITSITTSSAYMFVVGSKDSRSVNISLSATTPTSPSNVGASAGYKWQHEISSSVYKEGSIPGATYMPSLELSQLKSWFGTGTNPTIRRDQEDRANPDDGSPLGEVTLPWGILDDDGEDIENDESEEEDKAEVDNAEEAKED